MDFLIKQPESENEFKKYFQLRWQMLRAPWHQAEGTEIDDIEKQCYHVMAVTTNNDVIAVARLQFNSTSEAQIRYMAVAEQHRHKGIGSKLVSALEQQAINSGHHIIVLDARESAIDFYQQLGYEIVVKSYLLFDEIQHYRMSKELYPQMEK